MDYATLNLTATEHVRRALLEDMDHGDVSTAAVMPHARRGRVDLICKQDGVIAGLDVFALAFRLLDERTAFTFHVADGDEVRAGQLLAIVEGDVRVLLSAERTALNYLQRMSGIATATRAMVRALAGTGVTLVDTRKTTPGMRVFEKAAVRAGGGVNHRFNLSDCVMLKDNHLAAAGSVERAVAAARAAAPFTAKVEVEAETLEQVQLALDAGADIIMLDNMDAATMARAVRLVNGRALTECSGNITLERASELAELGVDFVSSGAITHSAGILDVSMKNLRVYEDGER